MNLYIDPGTGSMLFTILIGVLGALVYAFRNVFVKARFLVTGGKRIKHDNHEFPYVIFSDSKRYWNLFQPICEEMEKRGEKVLYLTASEDDPALACSYQYVRTEFAGSGNRAFARMNMIKADIVLSTTPGLDVYQWKRSRDVKCYIHIPHAIGDYTLYRMFGIDYYDVAMLTGPYQGEAVRKLEKMRNLPEKDLPIVGLPYLDALRERFLSDGEKEQGPTTVLMAPTWGKNGLLSRYGEKIFDALMKTGYHIIVRPHPQSFTSEKEMLDRLMAKYPAGEQIEWDQCNDNYNAMKRADVLISDYSGIIADFAFVFEKPVIYADFTFDLEPYDASWLEDETPWSFELLNRIGVPLKEEEMSRLGVIIDEYIHSSELKERREAARQEGWAYIGHSAERVADYLIEKRQRIREDAEGESRKA